MNVITQTKLTCPECGFTQEVQMPTESCQFFYRCVHCQATLRPKPGDCCVFCSYADVPCPSQQAEETSYEVSSPDHLRGH